MSLSGKVHIGISGWSYWEWKKIFYPETVKPADYLSIYAKTFDVTEINSSFYQLPTAKTIDKWKQMVPADFLFCPKISKFLTHMKKLNEPEEPLQRFVEVFHPLITCLGPVLIQLPGSLKFNKPVVEHFFKLLNKSYMQFEFALEARHVSWYESEAIALLKKYNVAFVIADSGSRFPYAEEVTANNIYLRFHGPGKLYASAYSTEELQVYAELIKKWKKAGHTIWAFFNNTSYGYALDNAKELIKMTAAKRSSK